MRKLRATLQLVATKIKTVFGHRDVNLGATGALAAEFNAVVERDPNWSPPKD